MTTPGHAACWVVSNGKAGTENQSIGLAEALGFTPIIKRVALRAPWRQLSPYLRLGHRYAFAADCDPFKPPWPQLVIASGRQCVAPALHIRKESRKAGSPSVVVFVQSPGISPAHFDLVIAPEHDRLRGANTLSTLGSLHRVTQEKLAAQKDMLVPRIAHLPHPYIGVLIGGASASYTFGRAEMEQLSARLVQAAKETGGSLLVTASRRTQPENLQILKAALASVPSFLWDGQGDNPYFSILGLADFLVVTADSVSMTSEAAATGKPVYVFDLPGGLPKSKHFHNAMRAHGWTRPFDGAPVPYDPPAGLDDMARAVAAVRSLLDDAQA